MEFNKLSAPTLKELFVEQLENMILSGKLAIGEKLPSERELAQSMQMMKELGASKEVMTEFLVKTMMLDEDQAKLYASVVDAKPPEDDGGMGGGFGGMRG